MTNFLLDENLSNKLVQSLSPYFKSITHIRQLPLIKFFDIEIWNYAKLHNFTIITKDSDFLHLSNLQGCPPKVIHLICGNKTTLFINNLLVANYNNIINFSMSTDCYMDIIY